MSKFRPNLAAKLKVGQTYEEELPKLPLQETFLVSPKLDGIRVVMHPELGPVTRSLKGIPNKYLRAKCEELFPYLKGFDGEMVWGEHTSSTYSFQKTFSKFSTQDDPDISQMRFYVFDDMTDPSQPFNERVYRYIVRTNFSSDREHIKDFARSLTQFQTKSLEEIYRYEQKFLEQGFEGAMLRHSKRPYKYGRSTMREGGLVALKRFLDAEAEIIGLEELMHNENEATINTLGYMERSSHLAGRVGGGTLGRLVVRGLVGSEFEGIEFKVGSGFNASQRQEIWDGGIDVYRGKIITFKYQPVGVKEKPRAPIFKSFREDL